MRPEPLTVVVAHERIMRAYREKRLLIHLDLKHLARPHSPAHEPLDIFVPLLILMPSSLTLLFTSGLLVWIVALSLVLLFQLFLAPFFVAWRVRLRVLRALTHAHNFSLIWAYGGVAIALSAQPDQFCLAPAGNWRDFAGRFLSEPVDAAVG